MANYTFADSSYRFINPIRYYKANDPYYFEVDNIPIKQLEENCLWLRDQLTKALGDRASGESLGIKRKDLDELRPYATGSDRTIRVKPGRFTARINDIGKSPLALYEKLAGDNLQDTELYKLFGANDSADSRNDAVLAALTKLKSSTSTNALSMNGLTERAFTWAVKDTSKPSDFAGLTSDLLEYTGLNANSNIGPFIYAQVILPWAMSIGTGSSYYGVAATYDETSPQVGFSRLPLLESEFIKRWRGVARTAIVDVPEELTVDVPEFSADDFYYIDENGTRVTLSAQSRIDLVFIYSKSVDTSATTVYKNGSVTQITAPALGIVRGAGIGPKFQQTSSRANQTGLDGNGNPMIMASVGDSQMANSGFTQSLTGTEQTETMKGSFPSPDDLLNLSPLLCNELEENAVELVGQSILPVAYVFVRSVPTTIAGTEVIDSDDVIDIRPFFRTAELSYNERAGIAAAVPQLSLANPAVGRAELDKELWRVTGYVDTRVNELLNQNNNNGAVSFLNSPRVAATGYVFGGYNYGPEAVLLKFYKDKFASNTDTRDDSISYIKNFIISKYGYGNASLTPIAIPNYPDWDIAEWCKINTTMGSKGLYPNDRITPVVSHETGSVDEFIKAGSSKVVSLPGVVESYSWLSSDSQKRFTNTEVTNSGEHGQHKVSFYYVSKKIKFTRPAWMLDYHVDVELVNSMYLTDRGASLDNGAGNNSAAYTGMWVEKGASEFTIYVAFSARDYKNSTGAQASLLPVNNRESENFASFLVLVRDILTSETAAETECGAGFLGNVRVGKCTYPTIKWKLTAIPRDGAGDFHYTNLNSENPTITLQGG